MTSEIINMFGRCDCSRGVRILNKCRSCQEYKCINQCISDTFSDVCRNCFDRVLRNSLPYRCLAECINCCKKRNILLVNRLCPACTKFSPYYYTCCLYTPSELRKFKRKKVLRICSCISLNISICLKCYDNLHTDPICRCNNEGCHGNGDYKCCYCKSFDVLHNYYPEVLVKLIMMYT